MSGNPASTESLLGRLVERSSHYPGEFSDWEHERLDEWSDGRRLSAEQVRVLTKIDVRTA